MENPAVSSTQEERERSVETAKLPKAKWMMLAMTKERRTVAMQLIGALTVLYVFLALLFAGLLIATIEVRQEEWIELPSDFFGDFSKVERPLVDLQGNQITRELVAPTSDTPGVFVDRFYNRPDGCTSSADDNTKKCVDDGDDGRWVLYPWVQANRERLNVVMNCTGKTTTALLLDGNVGDGNGMLGEGVCINFIPIEGVSDLL